MAVADLVYLLFSTLCDFRMTPGLATRSRKKRRTSLILLGLFVIFLTLFPVQCQQGQSRPRSHQFGSHRTRHVPREEGGGLAFIMDNWLFQRNPPSPASTEETDTPTSEGNEIDRDLYHQDEPGDEVTETYIETSWNEPASFIPRVYVSTSEEEAEEAEEATESAVTSTEVEENLMTQVEATEPSSSEVEVDQDSVKATEPTKSHSDDLSTSLERTKATEASPTTSTVVSSSPPGQQEGRPVRNRIRNRNRNPSGNRVRGGGNSSQGEEDQEAKKRTTRQKVITTEASKPAEEVKTGPKEGDIKLEGGDIEGTGNVIIYRKGEWGAICDDGWNIHSAHVVCRQLGHPHALGQTSQAYFGQPEQGIKLDNVQCFGDEKVLTECSSAPWKEHDCDIREAAGVFCAPKDLIVPTSAAPTTTTTARPTRLTPRQRRLRRLRKKGNGTANATVLRKKGLQALHVPQADENAINRIPAYKMRVAGGRNPKEGRLEVRVGGRWGVICAKPWTLREATIACKHLGLGYAQMAVVGTAFGGERFDKVLNGIKCQGHEQHLYECYHEEVDKEVECDESSLVAGVICTNLLPDLVPNGTMLEVSTYLDDVPMYYLTCAMEENCAAPSAYRIKQRYRDWRSQRRRLMRFSSSTWNFGTADFRPFINKELWEWHQCHMHYHSMEVFANYDILDLHGNKVADGHKASFCLEDVECMPGASKRYECVGYSDQGISVGCADNYLHNIDCQWVDITDLPNGKYIFRVHINPERMVPELSFENNAATCDLEYNGYEVYVENCVVGNSDVNNHG